MKYPKDAERILALLNHLNLTSAELARELYYKSPSSIYNIERGESAISYKMGRKIIKRYPQINFQFLIGQESEIELDEDMTRQQMYFNTAPTINQDNLEAQIKYLIKMVEHLKAQNDLIIQNISK